MQEIPSSRAVNFFLMYGQKPQKTGLQHRNWSTDASATYNISNQRKLSANHFGENFMILASLVKEL